VKLDLSIMLYTFYSKVCDRWNLNVIANKSFGVRGRAPARACERSGKWSGAGRKTSERKRSAEREVREWERSVERKSNKMVERGAAI
jgi:hypothetical protein